MGLVILAWIGCASPLADPTPYVSEARVLAVQVEPAEAEPGAEVSLQALYADGSGPLSDGDVGWSWCSARKPLAELGPVSGECLDPTSGELASIGAGLAVTAVLPEDACSLFGPNPPPPEEGGEAGRPVDPDITGGFYQPAVGFAGADVTLVSARVRCGLANVSQDVYVAWNQAYRSNVNPAVSEVRVDGAAVDLAGEPVAVGAGAAVALTVGWAACSDDPAEGEGCAGAEAYVRYDGETGELLPAREAVSVAWYATAGTFDEARGGRAGDEAETTVDNGWTAPSEPGDVWLAAVLRDERGGVGFAGWWVTVGG